MQAPVTPSGPPAQEPDGRACPACGASNGPLAAFCWQCYRQFGPAYAQAVPAPGPGAFAPRPGPPLGRPLGPAYSPLPAPEPLAPPKPGRSLAGVIGVLVFVVAVAAGAFVFLNKPAQPTLPESVGELTKITDPAMESTLEMFRSLAESQGVTADMGIYGSAGIPSAALIWVTGAEAPGDDGFAEFAEGFNTGLGTGSLDETHRTSEVIDGVTFECVPVVGEPPGSVCLWEEDGVFWMAFELSGTNVGSAQDLAVAAHRAAAA